MKIVRKFYICTCMIMICLLTITLSGCAFTQKGNREMVHITYVASDVVELEVEKGTLCSNIEVPSKVGYRFVGWYKDETYTIEFPSAYPLMEDITLYAKFERITYNVKFISGPGYRFLTDKVYVANYGESYTFTLEIFDGYDDSNMKVLVGEKILSCNKDGSYTIENIKSPLTVKVIDLRSLEHYRIYLPTNTKGYSVVALTSTELQEGETFSFCVVVDPAYSKSNFIVKANDEIINAEGTVYKVENLHEDVYIKVENLKINQYEVSFTDIDYEIELLNSTIVNDGDSFSFRLHFEEKYDVTQLVVKSNGTTILQNEDGTYTISEIKEDIFIDVSQYFIKEVHVTLDYHDGYEVTLDHNTYYYGSSAIVTIHINEGYEGEHLIVKCDGKILRNENNRYLVSYITHDVHVSIEGVNRKEIPVCIADGIGYSVTMSKSKVFYGDDVTFMIIADLGYNVDNASLIINGRGCDSNEVLLTNVKEALFVQARNVVRKEFTVECENTTGVKINLESNRIYYGEDLHFTIDIDPDFDEMNAKLMINGEEFALSTTTVTNVIQNITIEVTGLVKKSFEIKVKESQGAIVFVNSDRVDIHSDVYLTITTLEAYDSSNLVLHVNGETIILDDFTYVIEDICENLVIYLEDLLLKTFDISVSELAGVSLSAIPNSVMYGEHIEFYVTLLNGYTAHDMMVLVNGKTVSPIDGKYVISHVTENKRIEIKNVVKEKFGITMTSGLGYSILTDNALDVEYGEDFTFTILVEEGFRLVAVYVNGVPSVVENSYYKIKHIDENKFISVDVEKLPDVTPTPVIPESEFEVFEITIKVIGIHMDENDYVDYFTIEGDVIKLNDDVLSLFDIKINDEHISSFGIYEIAGLYELTIVFNEK